MSDPLLVTRRKFIGSAGIALLEVPKLAMLPGIPIKSESRSSLGKLPVWSPGCLDIHHIATGRGSCAFLVLPDGTTMLIDAGDVSREPHLEEFLVAPRPDASMRPGQWAARYIQRHLPAGNKGIDYFVLTHLHNDHMGSSTPTKPMSKYGGYRLSGITDIAEVMPVRRILDRAYPTYDYPTPLADVHQRNYIAFVKSAVERGTVAERFKPGRAGQIALVRSPEVYRDFAVRNLAANGEVWTGLGETTRKMFPLREALTKEQYPDENMCSAALKIEYGSFSYYNGGDLTADTNYGADPWRNIELPVAQVAGPVDVAVANHHGFVNACSPDWVRALRPRAFLVNAWTSAHPTMTSLDNMFSTMLYPGPREVYSTALRPESRIAVRRLDEMSSNEGHLVIRVEKQGQRYSIFNTSNADEEDRVQSVHGPFECGGKDN